MPEKQNEDRCKKHPDYDPHNNNYGNCSVCEALHHGTLYIGEFGMEFEADERSKEEAEIVVGPLTLFQLGRVRYALGFDNHYCDDASSWTIDEETRTVYIKRDPGKDRLKEFREYGCPVTRRKKTKRQPVKKGKKCA